MNNYILQLLKEIKTIIIPGIGAITLTNEATGEFMFMSYLNYDDGKLAASIAEKEGMELNDAKNLVSKFTREILAVIDKGESYDMYQFGKFAKVGGEIVFDQWQSENTESIPVEIAPIVTEPIAVTIEEPIAVETPVFEEVVHEKIEAEIVIDEPVIQETVVVEEIIEEKVAPVIETVHIEPAVEIIEFTAPIENNSPIEEVIEEKIQAEKISPVISQAEQVVEPIEQPTPAAKSVKPAESSKKETKKAVKPDLKPVAPVRKASKLSYAIWGVLVLLLGAGTYVLVNFDNLKGDFPILAELAGENDTVAKGAADLKTLSDDSTTLKAETAVDPEPIPEEEIPEIEPISEPEPEAVVVTEPVPVKPIVVAKPTPPVKATPKTVVAPKKAPVVKSAFPLQDFPALDASKPFHIIAGSFSSANNAKRFASQLKSKGMSELSIGEKAGVFRVSVKGFSTKSEASAAVGGVQNVAPGAWVLFWE